MKPWERFYSRKNMMDEMQEQAQLRIESAGYQVAFWGLLAAMVVQGILHCPPASMAGEWVVFMTLCLYVLVREMRCGLWDRHLKPNLGTNLLLSLLAGAAMAVFGLLVYDYWNWLMALLTGIVTALLVFGGLQLVMRMVKDRRKELDKEEKQS